MTAVLIVLACLFVSATAQCTAITDCSTCKGTSGCGWCDFSGLAGLCYDDSTQTACTSGGGAWNPSTCSGSCLLQLSCSGCLANSGCGWCGLPGGVGACYESAMKTQCRLATGTWHVTSCPPGANCPGYTTCSDCAGDTDCTACRITPDISFCVAQSGKDLYCPTPFYVRATSAGQCAASANADSCASNFDCASCSADPNCGWCNFGSPGAGVCYANEDQAFCHGLWKPDCSAGPCYPMSGLTFCTNLNGVSTDFPWVVALFDSYFATQWSLIVQAATDGLARYGITICQDCFDAYKKFLCAAAAPGCGYYDCYINAITSATACAADCSTGSIGTNYAVTTEVYECVMDCYSTAMFSQCSQFMLSRTTCANLLNICACNPSQTYIDEVCQFFSPTGGIDVDLGTGSCSTVTGWCSAAPQSEGFALQSTVAGKSCPNAYYCMSVYNSVGANTVSNPVQVYADQDAASTNAASPLLLLALLLLLFV